MIKQISLEKAAEFYNKGLDVYLLDAGDRMALPWNNTEHSKDFKETLGFYGEEVRAFIAFNVNDSSQN